MGLFGKKKKNKAQANYNLLAQRTGDSVFIIGKEQILNQDISMFMPFIENACIPQIRSGERSYAKMTIFVDDYNDDDRELWDIPEVIEWFIKLHKTYPYILYFLSPEGIKLYFYILAPIVYDFISIDLVREYCDKFGVKTEHVLSGKDLNPQKAEFYLRISFVMHNLILRIYLVKIYQNIKAP